MTRLIDADALTDKVDKYIYRITRASKLKVGESAIIADIKAHIELMPTVDAEPVKHGKWIGYAGTIGNECSMCSKWLDVLQGTAEMNYCPNCGARMDAERREK